MKVAYCTGFWCTNIGNGFFSLGVEHVLRKVFGAENVTVVSDYQTYTNAIGKRLYPDKKQLEYIADLDVDMVVLAGPVLSRYFLQLWKDILLKLQARGVRYMLLSAGIMKLNTQEADEIRAFFKQCPPYLLMSRERKTFDMFAEQCVNAYNGICFAFFAPEVNPKTSIMGNKPYMVMNFDKIDEPKLWCGNASNKKADRSFMLNDQEFHLKYPAFYAEGNLVCSFRHIHALLCLDRSEKEDQILWTLSGVADEFGLTEIQKSSAQHTAFVDGSYITIFDNGNRNSTSRVVGYCIDPETKTLKAFRSYTLGGKYSEACGSAQHLFDEVYVIGWGMTFGNPEAMSVVDFATGETLMSVYLKNPANNTYRCLYFD